MADDEEELKVSAEVDMRDDPEADWLRIRRNKPAPLPHEEEEPEQKD